MDSRGVPSLPATNTEPQPSAPQPLRRRRRRLLRISVVMLLLLLAAAFLRSWWLPPLLRKVLESQALAQLDWDLQLGAIETDGWSYLKIHDAVATPVSRQPLQRIQCSFVQVDFEFAALWMQGLGGVQTILMEQLALETDRSAAAPDAPSSQDPLDLMWLADLWPTLPNLQLHGITWRDQKMDPWSAERLQVTRDSAVVGATESPAIQLLLDSDDGNLRVQAKLRREEMELELDVSSLRWNPIWSTALPYDIPEDFNLNADGLVQMRLSLAASPKQSSPLLGLRIDRLHMQAQQRASSLEVRGQSKVEFLPTGNLRQTFAQWNGAIELQIADWKAFAADWLPPQQSSTSFGDLQSVALNLRYADGFVELDHAAIEFESMHLLADQTQIEILAEKDWRWRSPHFQIHAASATDLAFANGPTFPAGTARVAGAIRESLPFSSALSTLHLTLEQLEWTSVDDLRWLRQQSPLVLDWAEQGLHISPWKVQMAAGSFELVADIPLALRSDIMLTEAAWSASVTSENLDLEALQGIPGMPALPIQRGALSTTISLSGTPSLPILQGNLVGRELQPRHDLLPTAAPELADINFAFRWDHQGLNVEPLQYRDSCSSVAAHVFLALPAAAWKTSAQWPEQWQGWQFRMEGTATANDAAWIATLLDQGAPLRGGDFVGSFSAQGSLGHPEADVKIQTSAWQAQQDLAQRLPPGEVAMQTSLHWDRSGLAIQELAAQAPRIQVNATAFLALPLEPWSWRELDFATLPIEASLHGDIEELGWLTASTGLLRAQGQLSVHGTLDGTLAAPEIVGTFDLEDAAFRLREPGLSSLEDFALHADVDQYGLRLRDSHGTLGAAPLTLEGSILRQEEGRFLHDFRLQGEDLLLYRTAGIKVRAQSQLTVAGYWPQLAVGGSLAFTDSRVVQNIPILRSPIGPPVPPSPGGLTLFHLPPPFDQLQFALQLESDQGIALRSNLVRGRLRPKLKLEGTGAVPVLLGEVFLDGVSMTLPAARLYLQPSVVRFLEDNPFHPQLNLFGRSSLMGFEVQVVVTGPYDQPQVLLSSTPPLSEEDIILLLTTGQPPANRSDRAAAAGTVALYLARDFLTTFFNWDSAAAEESLLDRLEVHFGQDQTQNGIETFQGRLRLRDNFLREGDSLFLSGGRDAFEDFFIGFEWALRFE